MYSLSGSITHTNSVSDPHADSLRGFATAGFCDCENVSLSRSSWTGHTSIQMAQHLGFLAECQRHAGAAIFVALTLVLGLAILPGVFQTFSDEMTVIPRLEEGLGHAASHLRDLTAQEGAAESQHKFLMDEALRVTESNIVKREAYRGRRTGLPFKDMHVDVMTRLGHSFVDILKVDCEGCEFASFRNLFQPNAEVPVGQFLVETHSRYREMGPDGNDFSQVSRLLQEYEDAGLRLFHVEPNWRWWPNGVEWAFINVKRLA
ncbi:hypothetical protein KFL_008330010 [Klebsormidium nitens]|uniref:Methyltransferase domain-containing protein n=1 Tax=Klebsormidium nitens TaxID=105231 RepID=A0A1Y1IU10_KLENI|nr:hypothetical protein KFL_008330010 [Klebsormidium nitens]|eukprot:GAQ91678.1 hypothetical protein KFL_008330010 [Klebsormidium nitens]